PGGLGGGRRGTVPRVCTGLSAGQRVPFGAGGGPRRPPAGRGGPAGPGRDGGRPRPKGGRGGGRPLGPSAVGGRQVLGELDERGWRQVPGGDVLGLLVVVDVEDVGHALPLDGAAEAGVGCGQERLLRIDGTP